MADHLEPPISPASSPLDAPSRPPPRIDPAALQRHLARASRTDAPWLHEEIARRMADRLSLIRRQPAVIHDWWAPTSGSAQALQQQNPTARIIPIGLDDQPVPAQPAAGDAGSASRWWKRLTGGRPAADPAGAGAVAPAQMLWANMMLHWIDDLPPLLARWHQALEVDGFLMFSCFGPDTLKALRPIYAAQGWGPPSSDWLDMHDIGDALVHAGFADPVMDMEQLTLTWDSPQALLAELRTLGGNTAPSRQPGLRPSGWRRRLDSTLTSHLAGADGRLHLGFEIIYGHAMRPVTRAPVQASTAISLDAMREMTRQRNPRRTD